MYYVTKKSNQSEDESNYRQNMSLNKTMQETDLNKITELCLTIHCLHLQFYTTQRGYLT
jgi:hypothetical protein